MSRYSQKWQSSLFELDSLFFRTPVEVKTPTIYSETHISDMSLIVPLVVWEARRGTYSPPFEVGYKFDDGYADFISGLFDHIRKAPFTISFANDIEDNAKHKEVICGFTYVSSNYLVDSKDYEFKWYNNQVSEIEVRWNKVSSLGDYRPLKGRDRLEEKGDGICSEGSRASRWSDSQEVRVATPI